MFITAFEFPRHWHAPFKHVHTLRSTRSRDIAAQAVGFFLEFKRIPPHVPFLLCYSVHVNS